MSQRGKHPLMPVQKAPAPASTKPSAAPTTRAAQSDPAHAFRQLAVLPATAPPNPDHLRALERAAGNRAVDHLLAQRSIQAHPRSSFGDLTLQTKGGAGIRQGRPVQRKWSLDKADPGEVANLAEQGNYSSAFRVVLTSIGGADALLARFNAAVTAYTNAGKPQLITDALQATFTEADTEHAAWQVLDAVEGGAFDKLQQMFANRNVIVAGEAHKDIQVGAMEATLLPAYNISVRYENETIKATDKNVTPDPPAYRLLYFVEDFYEQLLERKKSHESEEARSFYFKWLDLGYERYLKEFNNYTKDDIENSRAGIDWASYDMLNKLKNVLFETLELIENKPDDDTIYNNPLICDKARRFFELFDQLKEESENTLEEPVMRKLRSEKMYDALKDDLAGAAKTVYKVGNDHVTDIRAKAGDLAWVLDEAQYKAIFRL
jgi:hypothetical protein